MSDEYSYIAGGVIVGIGATLFADLLALVLQRTFNVATPNFCLVGRWFRHMAAGTFRHVNIGRSPAKSAECATGWIVHYLVGITFALMLVLPGSGRWLADPTLLPAIAVGMGSVAVPFLIMQPAFGFGLAASKTPDPTKARLKSLANHAMFTIGLCVCGLPVSVWLRG